MHGGGRLFFAESEIANDAGQVLAKGSGVFTRSSIPLGPSLGYV